MTDQPTTISASYGRFERLARIFEDDLSLAAGIAVGDHSELIRVLDAATIAEPPRVNPDDLPIRATIWFNGDPQADVRDGGDIVIVTVRSRQGFWAAYRASILDEVPTIANFSTERICRGCDTAYTRDGERRVTRACKCRRHYVGMIVGRPK